MPTLYPLQRLVFATLFPDAKLTEDASQDFVGGDFTEDGTQFADDGAEAARIRR